MHPIGQFRQQFLRCTDTEWFADNYQVFVYPVCRYNLMEFVFECDPGNEIKKEIMIQETVHKSSTLGHTKISESVQCVALGYFIRARVSHSNGVSPKFF